MPLSGKTWFALGAVLLLLLALAGYGPLLLPGTVPASVHSDLLAEHLAAKQALRDSLSRGEGMPGWRADQFSGEPARVNLQTQYAWPLDAPFWLAPPERAAGVSLFLHALLSALAFAYLGLALGLSAAGILWLSLCGLFSPKLILAMYAGWLPHLPGIALAPALLAAAIRLAAHPSPPRAFELGGVGLLLSLAGHFQVAYYAALLCLGWWLAAGISRWRHGECRTWLRATALGMLSLLGVLLLSAWRLVPVLAELSLLSRAEVDFDFFRAGPLFTPAHLVTLLHPELTGSPLDAGGAGVELWETAAYFGIVPLLLAIPGAALGWRRSGVRFFVAAFGASLLFALDTPLQRIPYHLLPGFAYFRLPGRLLFIAALCGTALSGFGMEELLRRLGSVRRGRILQPAALALLAALVAGEGIGFARRYLAVVPQSERLPRPEWVNALQPADDPAEPYRVAPLGRHTLPAGWTARLGLQSVAGYDPWNLRHYLQYADILQHGRPEWGARVWLDLERIQRRDLLDRLNARYLISSIALADIPGLRLVGRFPDQPSFVFYQGMIALPLWVYENPQAAPRASWAGELVSVRDEAAMLDAVLREDLARTTVILGGPQGAPEDRASPEDALRLVSWAPGRLSIETRSLGPRAVRLSEVWHPGWRAFIDGDPAEILRADLALMAVAVPAGAHRLELQFEPPGEALGLWISALSAVTLVAGVLVGWRLRRRDARGKP